MTGGKSFATIVAMFAEVVILLCIGGTSCEIYAVPVCRSGFVQRVPTGITKSVGPDISRALKSNSDYSQGSSFSGLDYSSPPLLNVKYDFRFPTITPNLEPDQKETPGVEFDGASLDVRPFSQRKYVEESEPLYGPCGERYTGLEGIIKSPRYPYNYPPNVECQYVIEVADPTNSVSLNCQDFSIQSGNADCENDFLEIEIQPDNVTRYCGDGLLTMEVSGNLSMTFQSDGTFQYRGFMCRFDILNANGSKVETPSLSGNLSVPSSSEQGSSLCSDDTSLDLGWSGKCGRSTIAESSRIAGGEEVEPHEFPWMAAIIVECRKEPGHYCQICGGTVIHHNWVLTAGHCVANYPIEKLGVLLGEHNLYILAQSQKFLKISEVFVHPDWNSPTTLNNNLALLKTPQSVQFSKYVSPICLPSPSISDFLSNLANDPMYSSRGEGLNVWITESDFNSKMSENDSSSDVVRSSLEDNLHEALLNRSVFIYGWGKTGDVAEVDKVLRGVDVQIISNDVCNTFYGLMTDTMMCTSGEGGKGPCKGDSGAPNQMKLKNGQWVQVGILSFGASTGCEKDLPSGNVLLPLYMDWINFVTGVNLMDFY